MGRPTALTDDNGTLLNKKPLFFKAFEKVKYEIQIFICLLIFYIPLRFNDVTDDIYVAVHSFDYKIGFAPRLFIGSIMSLFTDYKSKAFMDTFFLIVFFATILLVSFVAGRIIRTVDDETKDMVIVLIALFIAIPYSLSVFYPRLVSVDRFLVLFTIIALILINKPVVKWFVPILLFMSLATHHGFAFMYMPVIAILLIYEIHRNKYSKQSILLCITSYITMAVFSAYFYLFKGISSFKNVDALIAYASDKTDIKFEGFFRTVLTAFLIDSSSDFYWKYTAPYDVLKGLTVEFTAIVFLMPIIIIFFIIWKNSIKNSCNKFEKFVFILCLLAPIARVPMLILSTNFTRGRIAAIVVQFFLVFYFLYTGNAAVIDSVKKLGEYFKKHLLLILLLIAYFALAFLVFRTGDIWSKILSAN